MKSHDMELIFLLLQTVATSITFSATSFRRTTENGTTTCGLAKPDLVLNFTEMSEERLLTSPPYCVPPEARCAVNCMQMSGCTSYNYKANKNECEIYFDRTMPCAHLTACFHHERLDDTLNFTQDWAEYKAGFGTPGSNYWMGLESVYQITNNGRWKLRMEMLFVENNTWLYAEYDSFVVDSEIEKYALYADGYSGTAGDCLNSNKTNWIHNGAKFSTYDNQNDNSLNNDCAQRYQCGWWFDNCYWVGLNLAYNTDFRCYLEMYDDWMLLKESRMKIQPV